MGVILGISTSRVICHDPLGIHTVTINLPLTNWGGLIEDYEEDVIDNEQIDMLDSNFKKTVCTIRNTTIYWTFNYTEWIAGNELAKFKIIKDKWKAGWRIELIPRIDQLWRNFNVIIDTKNFSVGIMKSDTRAKYNTHFSYRFKTEQTTDDWKWQETPDPVDPVINEIGFYDTYLGGIQPA